MHDLHTGKPVKWIKEKKKMKRHQYIGVTGSEG